MTQNAAFDTYLTALNSGVVVLRAFHGRKAHEFAAIDPAEARELIQTAAWLYGTTRFTRQQKDVRDQATSQGFSLSVLKMINRLVRPLASDKDKWSLWRELTTRKAPAGVIAKKARERVKELTPTRAPRTIGMRTINGVDGMGTLHFTAPQVQLADINNALKGAVTELMEADDSKTKEQAKGEAFAKLLAGDGGVTKTTYTPINAVPIDEHDKLIRGETGSNQILCSDGATLTDKQYLERTLHDMGIFVLVDRMEGAVDAFRDARFANEKQHVMAFVENPVCVAPGCCVPFDDCQLHHVESWKNGGMTNMNNLVPLCKYHNGKNDDDWWRRLNGHVEKRGPFAVWVSAYGFKDRRNEHRLAKLGAAYKLFE